VKPLRIAFACHDYPPFPTGGVGVRVAVLAPALAARGHRVTVIGMPPRARGVTVDRTEVRDGVTIRRLALPSARWPWRAGQLWSRWQVRAEVARQHRQGGLQVVEVTDGYGWMPWGAPAGLALSVRLEATVRLYRRVLGNPAEPFIEQLEARQLARATRLAGLSNWVTEQVAVDFPEVTTPRETIYNAVETDVFRPDPAVQREPGLVVFVNGLETRKGVAELLLSFNNWGREFPTSRLLLIGADSGKGSDGLTYGERCLATVSPELRERVTLAGRQDRHAFIVPALQRAAVAVYPSKIETFGIAPVEAMSCGCATVYSRPGPGPEVIEHGVDGLLCDPLDPAHLGAQIRRLLANPTEAAAFGAAARRTVEARFALGPWVERNERYFAGLAPSVTPL